MERNGFIPTSLISFPPSLYNLYLCFSLDLISQGFSHSSRKTAGRGFLCKSFRPHRQFIFQAGSCGGALSSARLSRAPPWQGVPSITPKSPVGAPEWSRSPLSCCWQVPFAAEPADVSLPRRDSLAQM